MAASGTVTLTCGVFKVPSIVGYKVSLFNEFVARKVIKYSGFASLVNIILGEEIFKEYLQQEAQGPLILAEVEKHIANPEYYASKLKKLDELRKLLEGDHVNIGQVIREELDECL